MKLCNFPSDQIKVGLRIKSVTGNPGTIVMIDHLDEYYAWTLWDHKLRSSMQIDPIVSGGIYWINCHEYLDPRYEVLEDQSIPSDVKLFMDNYPKCKCKDCLK